METEKVIGRSTRRAKCCIDCNNVQVDAVDKEKEVRCQTCWGVALSSMNSRMSDLEKKEVGSRIVNCTECSGDILVRIGEAEGEIEGAGYKCRKCYEIVIGGLTTRIDEMIESNGGESDSEDSIFHDARLAGGLCECKPLKSKVNDMQKKIEETEELEEENRKNEDLLRKSEAPQNEVGGNRLEQLNEELSKCREQVKTNEVRLLELNELAIQNARLKKTLEECDGKLAAEIAKVEELNEVITQIKQQNRMYQEQLEEYKNEGRAVGGRSEQINGWVPPKNGRRINGGSKGKGDVSPGANWNPPMMSTPRKENAKQQSQVETTNVKKRSEPRTNTEDRSRFKGREKIKVVGASIVRYTDKVVGMKDEGSEKISLGGAGIKEIMEEAVSAAESAYDNTKLFINGGGNSLKILGVNETVNSVVQGLKRIESKNRFLYTVFIGICGRPKENRSYDYARRLTNQRIRQEIIEMQKKGSRVIFQDPDGMLHEDYHFARDGVHLNRSGVAQLGKLMKACLYDSRNFSEASRGRVEQSGRNDRGRLGSQRSNH